MTPVHNAALVDGETVPDMTSSAKANDHSLSSRIGRKLREMKLSYVLYLACKRFGKPGWFEYDHQYVLSLDVSRVPHQTIENNDIREVTAHDQEDLDKTDDPPEVVLARFEEGQRLWVLERDGRVVAFDWIAGSEKTVSSWLVLGTMPGDFWGYFLKVSDGYRAMGLGPRLRLQVCRDHARAGYRRLLTTVAVGNRNSVSYQFRAGAVALGRIRFLSLFGITLLKHGSNWRVGFWKRNRPLRLELEDVCISGYEVKFHR